MVSANFEENPQIVTSKLLSSVVQTTILEFILSTSFTTVTILFLLPRDHHEYGNPVPIQFFKSCPSAFHAFVILLIFAFSGSYIALRFPDKPKISSSCGCFSVVSMALSVAVLMLGFLNNTCSSFNLLS